MMLNIRLLVKIKSKVKLSATCNQTTNCVCHIFCKKMSTGMLRVGSSRRSKAKSPYARPPAPSATPLVPRMQRTRGSTHTDSGKRKRLCFLCVQVTYKKHDPWTFQMSSPSSPQGLPCLQISRMRSLNFKMCSALCLHKRKMWHISQVCV